MSVPLNLTSGQQSLLAEICSALSPIVYDSDCGLEITKDCAVAVTEHLLEIACKYNASSQTFQQLYDKLHRTGANA